MIVKTLFQHDSRFALGEVEIKLLPGIPLLHVVGQPDSHIRECGIKLKSALKSCGLKWPQGHQIVVNLRPSHIRKSSSGVDLAIALGFLALTGQLAEAVKDQLARAVVYGEVTLDGRVFAPEDLLGVLHATTHPLLTGEASAQIRDGEWYTLTHLHDPALKRISRHFDWEKYWRRPQFENIEFHASAAEDLVLAAHMELNILAGGPQGSGKTTWARALYALTAKPVVSEMNELHAMFGESVLESGWRPFERPHHSITPLAMIGGGAPIFPGVISRAHGGVLVMDEFLEFHPQVLEGLREPLEQGYVVHARKGERSRFPSRFQLIATANLCPCGQFNPEPKIPHRCSHSLIRCRSVCARLSGPISDRFDMVIFSHPWLERGERVPWTELRKRLDALSAFRLERGEVRQAIPEWVRGLELSHRRGHSLLRVARGLADLERSRRIEDYHLSAAAQKVIDPILKLSQLFG